MIKFNLIYFLIIITLEITGTYFSKRNYATCVCVLNDSYKNNALLKYPSKTII